MNLDFLYGLVRLSFWGYVLVTFALVQVTMLAVTLYLHRDQAHRAVDLHPVLRHFFRFWIWATSGMITGEWVAVDEVHAAEAAGIVEADAAPRIEQDLDVVVRQARGIGLKHPQVPRHAEVDEQRASVGAHEQVLGAAPDGMHPPAGELRLERGREAPPEPSFVDAHGDDPPAPQDGLKAATGGFDFGEFRHFLTLSARLRA